MTIIWLLLKSSKAGIAIVIGVLASLIILPMLSVVVMASTAIDKVSDVLASVNPITHMVDIFDANGNKVAELELSTTWPVGGNITDEFGTLSNFRRALGLSAHSGIDIANAENTPITTFMDGVVTSVDNVDDSACGKSVLVTHDNGITSRYCHLNSAVELINHKVSPGDVIGYMGNTGTSTGSHLHFMIYVYNIPVNPRTFLVAEPNGTY